MVMLFSLFSFKINSLISIIPCGSRPLIGSSKIKKSGLFASAIAIPNLCFIPKEKFFAFFLPVLSRPTNFKSSSIPSRLGIPINLYCSIKLSLAVISP